MMCKIKENLLCIKDTFIHLVILVYSSCSFVSHERSVVDSWLALLTYVSLHNQNLYLIPES